MHGGAPQPTLGQYQARGAPVEVEGAGRSKAQLIVGIDFVSLHGQALARSLELNVSREQLSQASHSRSLLTRKPRKISLQSGQVQVIRPSKRYGRCCTVMSRAGAR